MFPRFDLSLLLQMLTFCRPARSTVTAKFCDLYIATLPGATLDLYGNWHVKIGDSPIIWSCHTDTVHKSAGRQTIHYDHVTDTVRLSRRSAWSSSCLGADDTAGVFMCVMMIRAQVPGHYIFHFAEEIGGIGSSDLAAHAPELLAGWTIAIALDRRGTSDLITHQGCVRCCSDAFAASLAAQLNDNGLAYKADDTGSFTDTASYTGIVAECTNLSIGYDHAHTSHETLNVRHLRRLLVALATMDQSALIVNRDPTIEEYEVDTDWRWYQIPPRRSTVLSFPADGNATHLLTVPTLDTECYACGSWYDRVTSDAPDEPDLYCSALCEQDDLATRVYESTSYADDPYRACYLDDTYAAVQDALSALHARKTGRQIH
jgi:hypothetical protein